MSDATSTSTSTSIWADRDTSCWLQIAVLTLLLIACYWNSLQGTAEAWSTPTYSHGYLIPGFALFLLYMRREPFSDVTSLERWWGVGLIAVGTLLRIESTRYVTFTFERLTLLVCLLGVFILVGGFRTIRWAGPAIAFLVFMFPLPGIVVDKILRPLQTMATISSVYALQTFGLDVYREGNRIELESQAMNVVDQCSGLRMLTIFIALAVAIALISGHRPRWERIVIVLSSVPIALLVNCIRITMTGLLYSLNVNEEITNRIFHDLAGWIMMPLAIGFLFLEMQILSRLIIEEKSTSSSLGMGLGPTI